jgi:hypothetical protein
MRITHAHTCGECGELIERVLADQCPEEGDHHAGLCQACERRAQKEGCA